MAVGPCVAALGDAARPDHLDVIVHQCPRTARVAKLRRLLAAAEAASGDLDEFTRLSRDFHLAVAEASHNRVLIVQLISLEHVSWPRRNVTATPKLARHLMEIHTRLADLIELRDPSGARALMDDHVKMIRARRVAEHGGATRTSSSAGRAKKRGTNGHTIC